MQMVEYLTDPVLFLEKESLYLKVRQLEGRMPDDSIVRSFPNVPASNPYSQEWRWRKRSFARLQGYLSAKFKDSCQVLDLGCGNGWMANHLAENSGWMITAMDLNAVELEQGARLFGRQNLRFIYGDILQHTVSEDLTAGFRNTFDVIILAASVQYFPDLPALIFALRQMLKKTGEIHIIDSHFYPNEAEMAAAKRRTESYYLNVGVPEMARYYYHHLWPVMTKLGGENLNGSLSVKLLQKSGWLAPFPWIRLHA